MAAADFQVPCADVETQVISSDHKGYYYYYYYCYYYYYYYYYYCTTGYCC